MHVLTQAGLAVISELWVRVSDATELGGLQRPQAQQLWELVANTTEAYALQHEKAQDQDAWAMFTWLQDVAVIRGTMCGAGVQAPKLQIVQSMDALKQ